MILEQNKHPYLVITNILDLNIIKITESRPIGSSASSSGSSGSSSGSSGSSSQLRTIAEKKNKPKAKKRKLEAAKQALNHVTLVSYSLLQKKEAQFFYNLTFAVKNDVLVTLHHIDDQWIGIRSLLVVNGIYNIIYDQQVDKCKLYHIKLISLNVVPQQQLKLQPNVFPQQQPNVFHNSSRM